MSKEILISKDVDKTLVAVTENGTLEDFHVEYENQQSILGNIYKGRVESILPSINGAFVNIGRERNGFLYLTDADNPLIEEAVSPPVGFLKRLLTSKKSKPDGEPAAEQEPPVPRKKERLSLKEGQDILVQVVKDPFAKKGARLTTHISLAGRFIVYMPCDKHSGISKKIEDPQERRRLREVLNELKFVKTGGFIIRTVSVGRTKKELIRDAKSLYSGWQKISREADKKEAPSLIYKECDLMSKVVRDYLRENIDKLTIDSEDDYRKIRNFVEGRIGENQVKKIHCYRGNKLLFEAKGIARQMQRIYDIRVPVKNGAHIVIEPTEGLTVVDVNSGKFKMNGTPEDAAFAVNMAAATEIARQLRLRDVGGIIVIDFIDMNKEAHKRKVLAELKLGLSKDRAKTEVNRISSLGLVEMTRARTGKTLEALSFHVCPYCGGRGKVRRHY